MKNFILSAFVAFAVSGCALFTSNDAPAMAGNINAVKSEVLSYTRQGSTSYIYTLKDLSSGDAYIARSGRYYAASGDVAYVSTNNGTITEFRIISRKAGASSPRAYNGEKIVTKQVYKNDSIAVPDSENISF